MDIRSFCVGENRINTYVLSVSFVMFSVGNMLFFSIPYNTCVMGFGYVWYAIGCFAAMLIIWRAIAMNEYYYSLKFPAIMTIPSFFEIRLAQKNNLLKLIMAGVSVFVSGVMLASIINILEQVLVSIFGIEGKYVLLILFAIALFVTNFGFDGILKLNVFRSIVLSAAMLAFIITVIAMKGPEGILMGIFYSAPPGGMTSFLDISIINGNDMIWYEGIQLFSNGLLLVGNAAIFILFLCFSNPMGIRRARGLSFIASLLLVFFGFVEGAFIRAFMAEDYIKGIETNQISLYNSFFKLLMKGEIHYKVSGILLSVSAVLCIMAIIEVSLYLILGILFNDIFREMPVAKMLINDNDEVPKQYRYITAFLVLLATYLWSYSVKKPVELAGFSLVINFCTIGMALLHTFIRKNACARSCVAGMAAALICVLFWEKFRFSTDGGELLTLHQIIGFDGVLPAAVIAEITMALVSLALPEAGKRAQKTFTEVKNHMT